MNDNFPLPPELERIEKELGSRPRGWPSEQLRERCLDGLQAELRRQRADNRWAFAVAVAATLFVGLNLAISAGQATDFGLRLAGRQQSVQETAAEIRLLLPDIPPREAARQAVLLHSGTTIVPCPNVPSGSLAHNLNLELAKFDL